MQNVPTRVVVICGKFKMIKKILMASVAVMLGASSAAGQDGNSAKEHYIIKYKTGKSFNVQSKLQSTNSEISVDSDRFNILASQMTAEQAQLLANDPDVEYVELDPVRDFQGEFTPYGIRMVEGNLLSDNFAGNQKVCIIDSGYDQGHTDLPVANVSGSGELWNRDELGHGTRVAGIIAALDNEFGIEGMAPNRKLPLYIARVVEPGETGIRASAVIDALGTCADQGATVVNMSLGGEVSSQAEQDVMTDLYNNGMLMVAAAGNKSANELSWPLYYPASYENVISVSSVDSDEKYSETSVRDQNVELSAPGVDVISTIPGNAFNRRSGTSFAAPHVSGVAALVWSHYPDCSNEQIRRALYFSSDDKGNSGRDIRYGFGIVKASAAHDYLSHGCDGPAYPAETKLDNGVTLPGISGLTDDSHLFRIFVPDGSKNFYVRIFGDNGNANLYVKRGRLPTTTFYDCASTKNNSYERCDFSTPKGGTYYILIHGGGDFVDISLKSGFLMSPVAKGLIDCAKLACKFSGHASEDPDGTIVSHRWEFGDGDFVKTSFALHNYASWGTYDVRYRVVDNDGLLDWYEDRILVTDALDLDVSKNENLAYDAAVLNWSGARGDRVDVYRGRAFYGSLLNDGSARVNLGTASGAYEFKVCETGSFRCSNRDSITY